MIDLQLLSEAGGQMLVNKIPNPVQQLKFHTGHVWWLPGGVVARGRLQADRQPPRRSGESGHSLHLQEDGPTVARRPGDPGLKRAAGRAELVPPLDVGLDDHGPETVDGEDRRQYQDPGQILLTAAIPFIADMITMAVGKLPKLLESQTHFMCLHKSGKVVANGPRAPPTPNQEVMISTEVDSYLKAVHKASTGEEAVALWRPGPFQPTTLKQLQHRPKQVKGHKGGSQGQGHKSTWGRGGRRNGHAGGHVGGFGGYGRNGRGPMIVNSGIHYHKLREWTNHVEIIYFS